MEAEANPANLAPGEFAPVPASPDELVVESLRFANRVSRLLNDLQEAVYEHITSDDDHRFDGMCDLLLRRHSDCSGLHLFIAAHNLRLDLPSDLQPNEVED